MFVDAQNEFSDSQAVTVTALSTNVIDTLPGADNPNSVQNLGGFQGAFLVVQVDDTFTAGGAATLTISLESDSTANLATSPTVHYSSGAIALATLVGGTTIAIIPLPVGDYEKYLGLRYTVGTGPMTAGSISAFITRDVQNWRSYAAGSPSNL